MGLSETHGIITNHSGEIPFKTDPEKGTTFLFFYYSLSHKRKLIFVGPV